jgi:NRAMP (natural resistance-associated macrophage protein)-like metal ion transporter
MPNGIMRKARHESPNTSEQRGGFNVGKLRSALRKLGPGLVTGAADDDPSGVATYSQVGAQFGYNMGWAILFSYPLLASIQAISAEIGTVTGAGLAQNLRRHYPRWLLQLVVNTGKPYVWW